MKPMFVAIQIRHHLIQVFDRNRITVTYGHTFGPFWLLTFFQGGRIGFEPMSLVQLPHNQLILSGEVVLLF